jgi:hypothetical protein
MDICDFCSSPLVVARFECCDFDSASEDAGVIYPGTKTTQGPTNLIFASKDFWAVCEECRRLVEAGDIDGLVKRALDEMEKKDGYPHPQRKRLEKHLRRTYTLFLENRIRIENSDQ